MTAPDGVRRILGLDPGLRRTGWGILECAGSRLRAIGHGVVSTDGDAPLAVRLASLHDGLQGVVERERPHEAAVEQTFVSRDAVATLKLGHARAVALLVPALAGLDVHEYAPNQVKKSVVGVGHADKNQILAMVRMLLPGCTVSAADAADALAVAITHAHRSMGALPLGSPQAGAAGAGDWSALEDRAATGIGRRAFRTEP
ncbi:MAG: crossover junction endodeoxyribonuclease RuvC [Alphaproteobacteria bacterium]